MDINTDDITDLLNKKIRIILSNKFTYVGFIITAGSDYIKFRDKYGSIHFLPFNNIIHIEEVRE